MTELVHLLIFCSLLYYDFQIIATDVQQFPQVTGTAQLVSSQKFHLL